MAPARRWVLRKEFSRQDARAQRKEGVRCFDSVASLRLGGLAGGATGYREEWPIPGAGTPMLEAAAARIGTAVLVVLGVCTLVFLLIHQMHSKAT